MKNLYLQITVDGPSGVGKGTLCKKLATSLNLKYLDSGTIYRAFVLRLDMCGVTIAEGYNPSESDLNLLSFKSGWYQFKKSEQNENDYIVLMSGENVTQSLRHEVIGQLASIISANAKIRAAANAFQKAFLTIGANSTYNGVILDGRKSGTEILPNADVKIFLECDLQEKAKRRALETGEDEATVYKSLQERDQREKTRKVEPLVPAEDAHIIDTTNLTIDQVFEQAYSLIHVQ